MTEMLFERFKLNLAERPDQPAFLIAAGDRSLPISWRQFVEDVSVVAWGIRNHPPGGAIAILGENSYEWMTVHAACLFSGVCVIPMDSNLSAEEISERLKQVGVKVLVYSSLYDEKVSRVRRLSPGIVFSGFGSPDSDAFLERARKALSAGGESVFDYPPPDSRKTAMIMFTSGTTSEPRGVELTLAGIELFCENALACLDMKAGERSLMILPVQHIFGICATYAMLSAGVAIGVCPDYRRLYDAVARFRADFVFLVPALADILASKIERRGGAAGIKWVCVGGAPLSFMTHSRLSDLGIQVRMAYGLTETTALFSLSRAGNGTPPGSAGEACMLPGVETKVSADGELMIRGANVFKGYFGDPARTALVKDGEGWFRTGDIGRIDEDGRVWITGRASRTIVLSSGKKVAPEELEAKILMYPGIDEVVVSGNGQSREIVAEVYSGLSEGEVHNIMNALNNSLPVYMRIKRVVCRKRPFPRTASGKIALSAPSRSGRRRMSLRTAGVFSVGFAAVVIAVIGLIPRNVLLGDSPDTGWQRALVRCSDTAGEILLGVFAIAMILGAWRGLRASRRKK